MTKRSFHRKQEAPVAVFTLRTVKPGLEERFEAELHDFVERSLHAEGQFGVSVMRPALGSGSREYGILRRFRDSASRDRFYESPLFREWEVILESLTEGEPKRQHLSGLETWFALPGQQAVIPPPRWKMAIVTIVGVWPASMLVSWLLNPFISGLPMALRALFSAAGIVIMLTWVVMPVLARILRPWLQGRS
jgi:hypothetical protein